MKKKTRPITRKTRSPRARNSTPKKAKAPRAEARKGVYEDRKWIPLFEDMPEWMSLNERAVFGYIEYWTKNGKDKECWVSAQTMGKALNLSEKTVDRSLKRLMDGNCIERTVSGKSHRKTSHYKTKPREEWHIPAGVRLPRTRVKASKTGVSEAGPGDNPSGARVRLSSDWGHIDPQRDNGRDKQRDNIRDLTGEHREENAEILALEVGYEELNQESIILTALPDVTNSYHPVTTALDLSMPPPVPVGAPTEEVAASKRPST